MKTIKLYVFTSLLIMLGCNKNDDSVPPEIELQNEPPLSFNLMEVPDGATDVDVLPTLSWESAKNSKGGEVTYDLYLGKETNPTNLDQSGISGTSFQIDERLNLISDYYWKVVATDADGQVSQSPIHKFTTRDLEVPRNPFIESAGFPARWGHTSVTFDGKLWVIGGSNGGFSNDIWQSADGVNWEEVVAEGHFSGRRRHASAVFDGKLWVVGGQTDFDPAISKKSSYLSNEVWFTENGVDWILATDEAPFSERRSHSLTVYNNALWLIGGSGIVGNKNDIWKSTDGINWTEVISSAPFSNRSRHSTIVFDNKIWLIGGNDSSAEDTFWFSDDGEIWKKAPYPLELNAIRSHTTCVFDDRLWIFGGYSGLDNSIEEAWYTRDGVLWNKLDKAIEFLPRGGHTTTVFDNKIFTVTRDEATMMPTSEIWIIE